MAFTDVTDGTRTIIEGNSPCKITLGGTVAVGDPVAISGGSGVQADANNSLYAELIAGETGDSGDEIVCYRSARIGGITTGTVGDRVYLSDTAGGYASTAGTIVQDVGFETGSGEMWVEVRYLKGTLVMSGAYTSDVIDFSSVTINHTGSNGPCFIRAGTYASPVANADEDQSGFVRLYGSTSANGSSYDRGVFVCLKTTGLKGIFPIAGLAEVKAQSGAGPNAAQAAQFGRDQGASGRRFRSKSHRRSGPAGRSAGVLDRLHHAAVGRRGR